MVQSQIISNQGSKNMVRKTVKKTVQQNMVQKGSNCPKTWSNGPKTRSNGPKTGYANIVQIDVHKKGGPKTWSKSKNMVTRKNNKLCLRANTKNKSTTTLYNRDPRGKKTQYAWSSARRQKPKQLVRLWGPGGPGGPKWDKGSGGALQLWELWGPWSALGFLGVSGHWEL